MASTYTPQDAVDYLAKFVNGVPVTDIDSQVCDFVKRIIWLAYPWRFSLSELTAINLVDGTQDYAYTSDSTTLFRLVSARVYRTDITSPGNPVKDVMIMSWIEPAPADRISFPNFRSIAHNRITSKIRFEAPIAIPSGQTLQLKGEYQKFATKITDANMSQAAALDSLPDEYFHMFCQGLLWQLFKFTRDKRAGTAQLVNGQVVYTGQLGEFHDSIVACMQAEGWGQGETRFPDDPLGVAGSYLPNIFGM